MAKVTIVDNKGKKVDTLNLDEKIFDGKVNNALLQQVVVMYLANQRKAFANTKDRSQVRGGGKKPWRQKGTGRARAGSIRSPLWKGGGVVFGPKPKDWHYQVPKAIKRQALISSFNAKLNEGSVTVIDGFKLESHKTKAMLSVLKSLKLDKDKLIIISGKADTNLLRSAGNIKNIDCVRADNLNAYQLLASDKVLIEKDAIRVIEKRLGVRALEDKAKQGIQVKAVKDV